jgi:hypothetical protein
MVPCFKWQSVLCVAFLAQAATAWAQEQPEQQTPLRFAPIAEMQRRGQTASIDYQAAVTLTLSRIRSGYIGQPSTFEVEIHNVGTRPTPANASLFVKMSSFAGADEFGLLYGKLAPNAKRTYRFEYKPPLPSLEVAANQGIWDSKGRGWAEGGVKQHYSWQYDPMAPLTDFLPVRPQMAKPQPPRVPASLSEVPEVLFAEPLADHTDLAARRMQMLSTLGKIKHVNQKKTDAYMELLVSERPDLAGLPFALGDACRRKGENRAQFAAVANPIRDIQRTQVIRGRNSRPGGLDDNRQMTEVVKALAKQQSIPPAVQVAALWQMITPESAGNRLALVNYLHDSVADVEATRALAKMAIFSEEDPIRSAALDALKTRRGEDYAEILVNGLNYPWPAIAERASAAIAKLGRADLVPQLQEVLKKPDPRIPQTRLVNGKPKTVVRELVRINHLRNCTLCHAPAESGSPKVVRRRGARTQEDDSTAEVPIPGETIQKYYGETIPDLLVRFDVTYLRQDFSVSLPVEKADPWPRMQRFDFVVRTREVNEQEARAWRELLPTEDASPYHRAAHAAITELSGREVKQRESAQ